MGMERRALERQDLVLGSEPEVTLSYRDPISHAHGYVVIDTLGPGRAYGGMRVGQNLSFKQLAPLARIGTVRYQLAGVPLGGAKCGLDYPADAPDKLVVLTRFLRTIRPYLDQWLSLGEDVGLTNAELEQALKDAGVDNRIRAVQTGQGFDDESWARHVEALTLPVGQERIREVRVPYFGAVASVTAMESVLPIGEAFRVGVLGMGPLGLRMARMLNELGCKVVTLGNPEMAVHSEDGLTHEFLEHAQDAFSSASDASLEYLTYAEALRSPVDALVLADPAQRLDVFDCGKLHAKLVIEAAHQAISPTAELILIDRNIQVLPNFAVTLGAIILCDGIVNRAVPLEVPALLADLNGRARSLVQQICRLSEALRISLRDAALRVAFKRWTQLPPTWSPQELTQH
jgi:glutamate dehydrogenase (NAD(P)+)